MKQCENCERRISNDEKFFIHKEHYICEACVINDTLTDGLYCPCCSTLVNIDSVIFTPLTEKDD